MSLVVTTRLLAVAQALAGVFFFIEAYRAEQGDPLTIEIRRDVAIGLGVVCAGLAILTLLRARTRPPV